MTKPETTTRRQNAVADFANWLIFGCYVVVDVFLSKCGKYHMSKPTIWYQIWQTFAIKKGCKRQKISAATGACRGPPRRFPSGAGTLLIALGRKLGGHGGQAPRQPALRLK